MLLKNKIQHFVGRAKDKRYHVRVDVLPSSYAKADEVAHKVVNAQLKNNIGIAAIASLLTRDSKKTLGIQLADLFLGAVMDDVCGTSQNEAKAEVKRQIAANLGWPDLKSDTKPDVWKFNIWHFWDVRGARPSPTRNVVFKAPAP